MAAPKGTPPSIEYRHNVARGRHELGVKVGDVFVPFATVDNARFDQLAENETNTLATERDESETDE